MEFNTIKWLPQHLAEMRTWKEICKAYDYMLNKAMNDAGEIYANIFLDSLTEAGCLIWERLLGIAVTQDESLEDRRQNIKSFFAGDLPYTENKLREVLENLAGPDAVKLTVTQSAYEIKVDLMVNAPVTVSNAQDIVYRMRPCNMIVRICIHYRTESNIYVGHAVKQIKVLKPTAPQGGNPVADLGWIVNNAGELLVDETGSSLVI